MRYEVLDTPYPVGAPKTPRASSCPDARGMLVVQTLGPLLECLLLSSIHGLPCIAFLFTGYFLKFVLAPFPSAPPHKLAPHNLACVIAENFVQHTFWFLGCPYHGLPR